MMRSSIVSLAFALVLAGCGSSAADDVASASPSEDVLASTGISAREDPPGFDEDAARDDAEQEVAAEGYIGPCTDDCSGHQAGFDYAAEGYSDGGVSRSPSFDEGQIAYEDDVDERLEEKRQEFEDGETSDYAI